MKILLYYSKSDVGEEYLKYPLGILYLASTLRKDHDVRFYDPNVDDTGIEEVVNDFDPNLIGVSFTTGSRKNAFDLVKRFPERYFVAGGFHPSCRPEECLDNGFNLVIRGYAELTFPELVRLHERKQALEKVYVGRRVNDLDSLPFPARELVPKDYLKKYNQAAIIGSRGCYSGCKFCGSAKTGLRKRSPENIISELETIVDFQSNQPIHFCDDIFTFDPKWVTKITQQINRSGLKIKYSVNSRVDLRDNSIFKKLKESGCDTVSFGIESGSQKILDNVGKNVTVEQIEKSVLTAKDVGLKVRTSWIVGLPGDYQEQSKSVDLMKRILPDQVHVCLNTPYPGTVYGDNPKKYGINLKTDNWTDVLNNIYSTGDFSQVIGFDYLSNQEIIDITTKIKTEMSELGIETRTFLDKKLMDFPHRSFI